MEISCKFGWSTILAWRLAILVPMEEMEMGDLGDGVYDIISFWCRLLKLHGPQVLLPKSTDIWVGNPVSFPPNSKYTFIYQFLLSSPVPPPSLSLPRKTLAQFCNASHLASSTCIVENSQGFMGKNFTFPFIPFFTPVPLPVNIHIVSHFTLSF